MRFTLLSRAYCHLCDEMETELRALIGAAPLEVVDIDAAEHASLEARYGEAVPVLFAGPPSAENELCRYRLDSAKVAAALAKRPQIR